MRLRITILLLAIGCLTAHFHCPLEHAGWLADCCASDCGEHGSEAPACTECPEYQPLPALPATLLISRSQASQTLPNLPATRLWLSLLATRPSAAAPPDPGWHRPGPAIAGPLDALCAHTASLRGPPSRNA